MYASARLGDRTANGSMGDMVRVLVGREAVERRLILQRKGGAVRPSIRPFPTLGPGLVPVPNDNYNLGHSRHLPLADYSKVEHGSSRGADHDEGVPVVIERSHRVVAAQYASIPLHRALPNPDDTHPEAHPSRDVLGRYIRPALFVVAPLGEFGLSLTFVDPAYRLAKTSCPAYSSGCYNLERTRTYLGQMNDYELTRGSRYVL